ncbi:MAG: hypothetical protein EOP53_05660, partial [Sphingobacteriales bacterium]
MKNIFRHSYFWLALGIFLLVASICADTLLKPFISKISLQWQGRSAQRSVLKKEKKAEKLLEEIERGFVEDNIPTEKEMYEKSRQNGVYFYIYRYNVLTFWTSNTAFPNQFTSGKQGFLQELGNGTYLQKNSVAGPFQFVALIPVQNHFSIQNQYLRNNFNLLGECENLQILREKSADAIPIYNAHNQYLFSITSTEREFTGIVILFGLGLLMIIFVLHHLAMKMLWRQKILQSVLLFSAAILLIVVPWKVLKLPVSAKNLKIFSPEYYASSELLSSLGDLVMLTVLVCYVVWFVLKLPRLRNASPAFTRFFIAFTAFLLFLFAGFTEHLVRSLVLDSQISFDLSNIFSLSFYSFVGMICVFGWLTAFFALGKRVAQWLAAETKRASSIFWLLLICFFFTTFFLWFFGLRYIISSALAYGTLLVLYLHYFNNEASKRYMRGFIYLVLSTLFLSACLIYYNQQKQVDAQRLLATRLATERDAIAEYLFNDLYKKIRDDQYIKSYYLNPVISSKFLQKRVKELYFSGYLSKYDVLVSSYTPDGIPFKIDYEKPLAFYQNILERGATPVRNKTLYFLHTYRGLPGYMATVPIEKDGYVLGQLLFQFQQKAFYEESVYPELLLTSNIQHFNEQNNYSYAIFNKNSLFTQKGNYPYPSVALYPPKPDSAGFAKFNRNGYTHLVYFINKDLRVVVSQPQQSIIFFLSIFTSVLIFLGLC